MNPLYDFHSKDFDYNKIKSSPPPTFKFLRDAEEKLLKRLMKLEAEKRTCLSKNEDSEQEKENDGSFVILSVNKGKSIGGNLHQMSAHSQDFNISAQDLNNFFGGPAFLAWATMGNLHTWGGPLSQNWLDQQLVLQKQIISQMIDLGMTSVLPSFSGNVPAALREIFPSANITSSQNEPEIMVEDIPIEPDWVVLSEIDSSEEVERVELEELLDLPGIIEESRTFKEERMVSLNLGLKMREAVRCAKGPKVEA
ncbi:hypothetical protein L2E82_32416 [Cichorium intybus]|uniref:Uncharacterized protein n=1 Tax=Cichorium intybus TaxID=13427 RepID=A0ACB9BHX7_CICIN|nr:hypothetical protein L2E82_32416 [Cichorium intybus]